MSIKHARGKRHSMALGRRSASCKNEDPDLERSGFGGTSRSDRPGSGRSHISGPRALAAPAVFDNLEFDVLPLLQGVECPVSDRRHVKEHVSLTGIGGNEPKPSIFHEF